MSKNKPVLKIFSFGHPLMTTEWRSILGDKYCHALPFDYVITDNMGDASVIAWDGVVSLKFRGFQAELEKQLTKGKVLLLVGESHTLFQKGSLVSIFNNPEIATIQLNGWSVLPEEILSALETCYQKITHV
jgi:hypothetical protein